MFYERECKDIPHCVMTKSVLFFGGYFMFPSLEADKGLPAFTTKPRSNSVITADKQYWIRELVGFVLCGGPIQNVNGGEFA